MADLYDVVQLTRNRACELRGVEHLWREVETELRDASHAQPSRGTDLHDVIRARRSLTIRTRAALVSAAAAGLSWARSGEHASASSA